MIYPREFLQASAALIASSFASSGFGFKKKTPRLAFSTLGCPDWTLNQIVDFAANNHYQGIEVREFCGSLT